MDKLDVEVHNITYSCCPDDVYPNLGTDVIISIISCPAKKNIDSISGSYLQYENITVKKDYKLDLRRKSKFYSQNLLVPCVLISMLAPFTFLLPGLINASDMLFL